MVNKKGIYSVRLTPGRQWTKVSKTVSRVPKILSGLYKENAGQSVQRAIEVGSIIVLGVKSVGSLAGSWQSLLLEGVVSVPIRGCLALRVFRLH